MYVGAVPLTSNLALGDSVPIPTLPPESITILFTSAVAKISKGLQEKLYLGNLNAKRDWGDARDFIDGMWRILQQKKPDDFVLATGKSFTVRKFVELAFKEVEIKILWRGERVE